MKSTQVSQLIEAMKSRWVTPLDAQSICGTMRFSARVLDIKLAGYSVEERWVETQSGARVKAMRISA